jgi:DNA-binding transcriptional LysR family regulator
MGWFCDVAHCAETVAGRDRSDENPGRQNVGQSHAMQHLAAKAIEDGEADIGAVLGRIDMHPKRPLAERRVDDRDDGIGPRYLRSRQLSPRVRAFIDWLVRAFSAGRG